MENGIKRNLTSGSSIISNLSFLQKKKKRRSLSEGRAPQHSQNGIFSSSFLESPISSVSFYQEVTDENNRLVFELSKTQAENKKLEKLNQELNLEINISKVLKQNHLNFT